MTVHQYCEIKCDQDGCRAHWPSQGFNLHYPGNGNTARRMAAPLGWTYSSVHGDFCPAHSIPVSHTVVTNGPYTMADLIRPGSFKGYLCPVPDCCSIPWANAQAMLKNHVNRPHLRCPCGWVGISLVKHQAARKRSGLEACSA